jgi:hypothetical protein
MRRKAVHLFAAIAESLRFFAIAFLAFSVGALLDPSVSSLLRYAAVPQLLFAAGFFFLWLDPIRYAAYRPLLLIGKIASACCFPPLAAAIAQDPAAIGSSLGVGGLGLLLTLFIALVDIADLSILILVKGLASLPGGEGAPKSAPKDETHPGQGPEDIERVEA